MGIADGGDEGPDVARQRQGHDTGKTARAAGL